MQVLDPKHFLGGQLADVFGGQSIALQGGEPPRPTMTYPSYTATCTASGSTNTKGSYTQVVAALDEDCYALQMSFPNGNFARDTLVDIAIGAGGSEVVLINNIFCSSPKSAFRFPLNAIWPVFIKKGTRIAARCQCTVASNTQEVFINPIYDNPFPRIYRTVESMGPATGDSGGVSIDTGASANTEGAWTQLIASTSRRIRLLTLVTGNQNNAARSDATFYVDVAIGASSSEVQIIQDCQFTASLQSDHFNPLKFEMLPVDIPAGSRVSARAQCNITDATDRLFDLVAYGFAA